MLKFNYNKKSSTYDIALFIKKKKGYELDAIRLICEGKLLDFMYNPTLLHKLETDTIYFVPRLRGC